MPVATVGSPQTIALGAADALIVSCSAVDAVASVAGSTGFVGAPYELGRVVGEQGRRFGPYGRAVSLIVSSLSGSITAEVSQPSRAPDAAGALSAGQAAAAQALVSADGNLAEAAVAGTTGTPGEVRKLSDGPNKGVALTWAIPEGRSAYAWCWQIYPLAAYL